MVNPLFTISFSADVYLHVRRWIFFVHLLHWILFYGGIPRITVRYNFYYQFPCRYLLAFWAVDIFCASIALNFVLLGDSNYHRQLQFSPSVFLLILASFLDDIYPLNLYEKLSKLMLCLFLFSLR